MTAEVEARLGEGPVDGPPSPAEPIAIVERVLARRIAAVGGRDEARIGLEKIEALAALFRKPPPKGARSPPMSEGRSCV